MDPHQQARTESPDLALMYNSLDFDQLVADLVTGDLLEFNATLLELGSRGNPHLGFARGFQLLKKNDELPPLFNEVINMQT